MNHKNEASANQIKVCPLNRSSLHTNTHTVAPPCGPLNFSPPLSLSHPPSITLSLHPPLGAQSRGSWFAPLCLRAASVVCACYLGLLQHARSSSPQRPAKKGNRNKRRVRERDTERKTEETLASAKAAGSGGTYVQSRGIPAGGIVAAGVFFFT